MYILHRIALNRQQACTKMSTNQCNGCPRFLAATKQLYEWFSPSICPSVCPSVFHTFLTMFPLYYHENFQELLPMTTVMSMQKVKVRGQRSRTQRSKPNLAVSGPYLQFDFTYDDEMIHKAWCCLGEVPCWFLRSSVKFEGHSAKNIVDFDPNRAFPDCKSSLNSPMPIVFRVICQISRSHWTKNIDFDQNLAFPDCNSSLKFIDGYEMMHKAWSSIVNVPYCFFRSSVKL